MKIILLISIVLCSNSENLRAQLYVSDEHVYLDVSQESISPKCEAIVYIKGGAVLIGKIENSEVIDFSETSAQKNKYLTNFAVQKIHRKKKAFFKEVYSAKARIPKINNIFHLVITDYKKQKISINESVGQYALLSGSSQLKFIIEQNPIISFSEKNHFFQLSFFSRDIYVDNMYYTHFRVRPPPIFFT
ncbi:MAG: hypothetical protein LCH28_07280 [Bacteroidetes bacterium]|nr:hypothetical protein [Bacteroidota bacterium]